MRVLAKPGRAWQRLDLQLGPKGHPALRRRLVRQVLANGIDRGAIARAIFGPLDEKYPSTQSSVFLLGDRYHRANWHTHRYRPAYARGLLEQARCTRGADGIYSCDGRRLSLRFVTAAGVQPFTSILPLVQRQLRRAGIEAVTEFSPPGTFFTQMVPSGDHDVVLFAWVRTPSDTAGDLVLRLRRLPELHRLLQSACHTRSRPSEGNARPARAGTPPEQGRRSAGAGRAVTPLTQNPFVVVFRAGVRGVDVRGAPYPLEHAENWWLDD